MLRKQYLKELSQAFHVHPIVALLGPRQCGKTTLAKQFIATQLNHVDSNYFDLEDPESIAKLQEPKQTFSGSRLRNAISTVCWLLPKISCEKYFPIS